MVEVMKGIRILEVAEHTFVPLASGIAAEWGAEVIKIEHVERGDATRGRFQRRSPATAAARAQRRIAAPRRVMKREPALVLSCCARRFSRCERNARQTACAT